MCMSNLKSVALNLKEKFLFFAYSSLTLIKTTMMSILVLFYSTALVPA